MIERTLIIIKPDVMAKGLVGEILSIYEKNRLRIVKAKITRADDEVLGRHYEEHTSRDFYPSLVEFMKSEDVFVGVLEGENAVANVRIINGKTNPKKADPNSIRYMYGTEVQRNAVHGSADPEAAKREIAIWFGE